MVRPRGTLALVAVTVLLAPAILAQKAPPPGLPDLLRLGAEYAASYAPKISGVTLEEQLMLIEVSGTGMRTPIRVTSDVVLLNLNGRLMSLRDLFTVDGKALRERTPRITEALATPSAASWLAAQGYAREHAAHLLSNVVLWYSDPLQALEFIAPDTQKRLTYKLEGNKRLNGVQTMGVGYKETAIPNTNSIIGTPSSPLSSGRFYLDPATGAIHQTELWIQSDSDTARVQVVYAPDAKLGLLLPREASHTFEQREGGTGFNRAGSGGGTSRLRFESTAKYSNARHTPIDFGRIVR